MTAPPTARTTVPSVATARALALVLSVALAVVLIGSLRAALAGTADFGLVLRPQSEIATQVRWVNPGSPAWDQGLRTGDVVRMPGPGTPSTEFAPRWGILEYNGTEAQAGLFFVTAVPPVDPLDIVLFALGVGLLALGVLVLSTDVEARYRSAFWRLGAIVGGAFALAPAVSNGLVWAMVARFAAVCLIGPATLALAWALPLRPDASDAADASDARPRRLPFWLVFLPWLPACAPFALYLASWRQPHLYPTAVTAASILLAVYLVGAALLLALRWRSAWRLSQVRAQCALLLVGLALGSAPYLLFTWLPRRASGSAWLPDRVSALGLIVLALSIALVPYQQRLLRLTRPYRRPAVRALTTLALAVGIGGIAGLVWHLVAGPSRWSPAYSIAAFVTCGALLYWLSRPPALRLVEGWRWPPSADPARVVLEVSAGLGEAANAEALAESVVTRLGARLGLAFVFLVGPTETARYQRAASELAHDVEAAVLAEARRILSAHAPAAAGIVEVAHVPVLFIPLATLSTGTTPARVLCLGPRADGERLSVRHQALLRVLAQQMSAHLHTLALHDELDARLRELERMSAERAALAERLISVAERERRELAAILHDEIIQLAGQVERVLGDVVTDVVAEGTNDRARESLVLEAWKHSHEVTARLREVVSALHPPPLDMAGLVPALQTLLREAELRSGVRCVLLADPAFERTRLPAEAEQILYQLAREGVTNAIRHGAPRTVRVDLRREADGGFHLAIRDDGHGFEPQAPGDWLAAGHLGLALVHERVHEVGGEVALTSGPDAGTVLSVRLPPSVLFLAEAAAEPGDGSTGEKSGVYSHRRRG